MKLFDYQTKAVNFILKRKKCALFLDCGMGKTLSVLTALYLKRKKLGKILVIGPKMVIDNVWEAEIKKWNIPFSTSKMLGSPEKRLKALNEKKDIYLINVDNLEWLANQKWGFKTVVIDELSLFKSYNSKRFKILKKQEYEYFIGMTGTPTPNGLMQLWPEIYLIDQVARLGKNITAYRNRYYGSTKSDWGREYYLNPQSEAQIHEKIKDVVLSMNQINAPETIINDIYVNINMTNYNKFKNAYIGNINGTEIFAGSAAVLAGKLRQLANGAIYDENNFAVGFHYKKVEALENLILSANGEPVLVFYNFIHDKERIMKYIEARELKNSKDVQDWNEGKIPVLLAHPASCGHGLNLQKGGRFIAWFGVTWDLELYIQANARLARTGQDKPVIINRILTKGTIDEYIIDMLKDKSKNMDKLIEAVKECM